MFIYIIQATKEHIRDVNSQLKGFSSLKLSEILETRMNTLIERLDREYYPKIDVDEIVKNTETEWDHKINESFTAVK